MSSHNNDRLQKVLTRQQSSPTNLGRMSNMSGISNASSSVTSLSSSTGHRLSSASVGSGMSNNNNRHGSIGLESVCSDNSSNHSSRRLFASSVTNLANAGPMVFTSHELASPGVEDILSTKSSPNGSSRSSRSSEKLSKELDNSVKTTQQQLEANSLEVETPRPQAISSDQTFDDLFAVKTPTLQTPTGSLDSDADFEDSPATVDQDQLEMDARLRDFYNENGIITATNTTTNITSSSTFPLTQFPFNTYDHNEPVPVDGGQISPFSKVHEQILVVEQPLDTVAEQDDFDEMDPHYISYSRNATPTKASKPKSKPMPELDFDLDQAIQQAIAISARASSPKVSRRKSLNSVSTVRPLGHSRSMSRDLASSPTNTSMASRTNSGSPYSSYRATSAAGNGNGNVTSGGETTPPRTSYPRRDYNLPKVNINETLEEIINESNEMTISGHKNYSGVNKFTSGVKKLARKISIA